MKHSLSTVGAIAALFSFLFLFNTLIYAQSNSATSPAITGPSLDAVLDESGRLKPNFSGSFDPRGYSMTYGPKGEPIFTKSTGIASMASPQAACTENWDTRFGLNGAAGAVFAIASDSQGNVYVGGNFLTFGNLKANYIVKWDGSNWSTLGTGLDSYAYSIAVSGTDIYVGGNFQLAGGVAASRVAKWDGTSWSAVGSGVNGIVYSIALSGSDIYVGGVFTTAGSVTANRIAKWDGTTWSALGTGMNANVNTVAVFGSDVYAGGGFTTADGASIPNLAKWDGTAWSAVGSGVDGEVRSLTAVGSNLIVAGQFLNAGGSYVGRIAKWNGSTWSGFGTGLNSAAYSVAVSGSDIYVGGSLTNAGGTAANYVAKWNGTSWSALGSGVGAANVTALAVVGSDLYAGGSSFLTAGSEFATRIAKWNGSSWSAIKPTPDLSVNGTIRAVTVSGSDIYIGGDFTEAGGIAANRIAKWNGTSWSTLGTGLNSPVYSITISGSDIYVGGAFTTAGGVAANRIAKWNGSSWSALGSGFANNAVAAIAVMGSQVYATGSFTLSGSTPVSFIAVYDGTSWGPVGSGLGAQGFALAVIGSDLYVGGLFSGANPTNYLAKWDGTSYSAVGSGIGGVVYAMAVSGTDLYVAGAFITAGGNSANRVAKWNGTSWSGFGTGTNQVVYGIAVSGSNVYVTGNFTSAGAVTANRAAKWNGTSWSALGSGLEVQSNAIGVIDTDIYVGGTFVTAGCGASAYFGHYIDETFTGASTTDWHTAGNWASGSVPNSTTTAVVRSNATITSADATIKNIQVNEGSTVSIASGRTLTVSGTLTLNGDIEGPGTLVITQCDPAAVVRVSGSVKGPFVRCVNNAGSFLFPVGTTNGYSPVTVSNVSGTGDVSVTANQGAYTGTAAGLPPSKLARWWNVAEFVQEFGATSLTAGVTSVDLTFSYLGGDATPTAVSGYSTYRISGGTATNMGGTLNTTARTMTVAGVTQFSDWTLAGAAPTAASAMVEGRVLDRSGRPVANASVSVTKQNGEVVTVKTNSFGVYRLSGLETGETVIIGVFTKRWQYTPRVVTLTEDLWGYDLTPQ